jgi:hypothetical protein
MTRTKLKPSDPLVVGKLFIYPGAYRGWEPQMGIAVWCPWCKAEHIHGWDHLSHRSDHVEHRVADCHGGVSPFERGGYYIGLDAGHAEHNRGVIGEFKQLTSEWGEHHVAVAANSLAGAHRQ